MKIWHRVSYLLCGLWLLFLVYAPIKVYAIQHFWMYIGLVFPLLVCAVVLFTGVVTGQPLSKAMRDKQRDEEEGRKYIDDKMYTRLVRLKTNMELTTQTALAIRTNSSVIERMEAERDEMQRLIDQL